MITNWYQNWNWNCLTVWYDLYCILPYKCVVKPISNKNELIVILIDYAIFIKQLHDTIENSRYKLDGLWAGPPNEPNIGYFGTGHFHILLKNDLFICQSVYMFEDESLKMISMIIWCGFWGGLLSLTETYCLCLIEWYFYIIGSNRSASFTQNVIWFKKTLYNHIFFWISTLLCWRNNDHICHMGT